jgi:outer membrane protein assembly factor BamB
VSGAKRWQSASALVLPLLFAGAACGGAQDTLSLFSGNWSSDNGASIAQVQTKLRGTRPPPGADVVVGIAGNGDKIIGVPLGGGPRWTVNHPLDSRPLIAGTLIIGSGGGELFALDATNGKKVWTRMTGGLPLRGAGDDGNVTVVTLGQGSGAGSTLLAIARNGGVVRQLETDKSLGIPAVLGGLAFVPWGNQYVTVIDLSTGEETARILLREKTTRAWAVGGALYFGEVGMFRFDEHIKDSAKNHATHVSLPARELPGSPVLMPPGEERQGLVSSARDKIRLFARPSAPDGPLSTDTQRFYATYFRLVMGFESQKGKLAWVHTDAADIIGGSAGQGTLVTCDEQGKITILDAANGGVIAEHDLGEAVKSCTVQVDAFHASSAPKAADGLAAQLAIALTNGDADLATAQRLLLREMATLDDELATKVLVDLASNPRTGPPLLSDARAALAARRNGAKYMMAALEMHYDFLKDVLRAPPVGPIAQALAAMKEKRASPLLASHLLDPANNDEDVKQAAAALAVLADASEVPSMKEFFALYRASAETPEMEAAVVNVAQGLLRTSGKDGRAIVDHAIGDPLGNAAVKEKLRALVESTDAENAKPKN